MFFLTYRFNLFSVDREVERLMGFFEGCSALFISNRIIWMLAWSSYQTTLKETDPDCQATRFCKVC